MNLKFIYLFFIFTQVHSEIITDECTQFIDDMHKKSETHEPYTRLEELSLKFSAFGSKTKSIGAYDNCTTNSEMYYFTHVIRRASSGQGYGRGLCLPKFCSSGKFFENLAARQQITQIFKWDRFYDSEVAIYDPLTHKPDHSFMYVFSALLIIVLIVMNVVALFLRGIKTSTRQSLAFIKKVFDPVETLQELFQTSPKKSDKSLYVFDFLRTVSCTWILGHHVALFYLYYLVEMNDSVAKFMISKIWLFFYLGYYGVEIFFVIQGFFAAYSIVPKMKKASGIRTYAQIILNRLLRTWPAYMLSLLVSWKIGPKISNGPLGFLYHEKIRPCDNFAYKNALYIDNLIDVDYSEYCYDLGWFLAVDFQNYLVFPIVVLVYAKKKRAGYFLCLLLIVQGLGMALISCFEYDVVFTTQGRSLSYFWHFYRKPWLRWFASFPGMILGFMYIEYKSYNLNGFNIFAYFEKRRILAPLTTFSGFLMIFFVVFFPHNLQVHGQEYWHEDFRKIWVGMASFFVTLGTCMIFMPHLTKKDSMIKRFMSFKVFRILGTLSYSVYLVQFTIILIMISSSSDYEKEGDVMKLLRYFCWAFIFSNLAGLLLHIIIERPMALVNMMYLSRFISKDEKGKFHQLKDERSTSETKVLEAEQEKN